MTAHQIEDGDVFQFLLGESPLDGLWFGEKADRPAFWWRRPLREAQRELSASQAALAEARRDAERLIDALMHILWIKDCGVDTVNEAGDGLVNHPADEREAMYEIARAALAQQEGKPTR